VKVFFRVDSSAAMGMGHLSRCITLAEALRRRGCSPVFVGRAHPGNLLPQLALRDLPAIELPVRSGNTEKGDGAYSAWLGAEMEQDLADTVAAFGARPPSWVVVDHYGVDARWERGIQDLGVRVLAIDDLADRQHLCEMLLDQNFSTDDDRYKGLTAPDCRLLLGPKFALLNENYATHRRLRNFSEVRGVFIFFGGSDPQNFTGMALQALSARGFRHLRVDVVLGANNVHRQRILETAELLADVRVHDAQPHLAGLIAAADLAIGAAGTTTYERMCLGVPSLVVAVAENQRPGSEALARAGMIEYLGPADRVSVGDIEVGLNRALGGAVDLAGQSLRGALAVDGLGALRVAECLQPAEAGKLTLRKVTAGDIALLFSWTNDRDTRKQSVNSAEVGWPEHQRWFAAKLVDPKCQMLLLESSGLPLGQIRFDADGEASRISFSMDAAFRGRGWGKRLVAMGMRRFASESGKMLFSALVKKSNPASAAVFRGLGFRTSEDAKADGLLRFDFDLARERLTVAV
jgi:UDP-2,4-diacetamido-2,4,6-trideoxy-beta-L-altropyranose hydrolase